MSGPPEDIEDKELFRRLMERPKPADEIDWPSRDIRMRVRVEVQRVDEIEAAHQRVQRWVDQKGYKAQVQQGMPINDVISDRVACEILSQSIKRPKPIQGPDGVDLEPHQIRYPRIFKDADDVRKALFPDEVSVLWNAYQLVQYKFGPHEGSVKTAEELNEWVKRLAEGAKEYPLLRTPLPQLLEVTLSLAARVYSLSAVLDTLLPQLPESWASALTNSAFGIGSSFWPAAKCTESGLSIDAPSGETEPAEMPSQREYIDVAEIARSMVRDARATAIELPDTGRPK